MHHDVLRKWKEIILKLLFDVYNLMMHLLYPFQNIIQQVENKNQQDDNIFYEEYA